MSADTGPLIVAAVIGGEDLSWLDRLRRTHYPPERNRLPAHLTLFHHLPPSIEAELKQRLGGITRGMAAPPAEVAGAMDLGNGVALRILSPALEALREELAGALWGVLTPQDAAGWRPHITIQNKVAAEEARRLRRSLDAEFWPRLVRIAGLGLWRYRGGLWEPVSQHMFRT